MPRPSFRSALAAERPLVTPLAHDALSARLIERAGFKAFAIGGSAMLAARHAYPDIGLIGLTDMTSGIRDIACSNNLPFFADGDDGYGDVKSVVRMVDAYEAIGVGAVLIEDQLRDRKQQRADKAAAVVDREVIEHKIKAALGARQSREFMVAGRTDAYGALGLDEALRRAERFMAIGADGVFVAGLRTEEDFARVGRALKGAPFLSAAMFEGSGTPWLPPKALGEMGFTQVSFPVSLIFRAVAAMTDALANLRRYAEGAATMPPLANVVAVREALDEAVDLKRWRSIESTYRTG
ncbi:MAG TPA: isocitrate lyase/PEP mutase family protein [Alphaproteobacteria bacterium]|nr:isocitrate lyase/PEP mutase family protein [Alphaproteobacteria bacterium]